MIDLKQIVSEASQAFERGELDKAFEMFNQVRNGGHNLKEQDLLSGNALEVSLNALVQIALTKRDFNLVIIFLKELVLLKPEILHYTNLLAKFYAQSGKWLDACDCYYAYLKISSTDPEAYFNLAYHLRKRGKFTEALKNYQKALDLNVRDPQEVLLNMAIIYSEDLQQELKAQQLLEQAIEIQPSYISALYNLANLYEQSGEREKTLALFMTILKYEPSNYSALARISDLKFFNDRNDPYIQKLKQASISSNIHPEEQADIYFALGKVLNDCGDYHQAFEAYTKGNACNKKIQPAYNHEKTREKFLQIKKSFNSEWFEKLPVISTKPVVFICGMFRSGSTLIEQILSAHSQVFAAGELDFFVRLEMQYLPSFPKEVQSLSVEQLKIFAGHYIDYLKSLGNKEKIITDKRPDNFIYLGLIKALFPNAKIIITKRNPLDNCLSVYFLRLASRMNYANEILDIAKFYSEQEKLMAHWKSLFPDSIHTIHYDRLIEQPASIIKSVLGFLDLEWEEKCVNFHENKNYVKTASVWQVRKPLYQSSSGRWRNYENNLAEVMQYFDSQNIQYK